MEKNLITETPKIWDFGDTSWEQNDENKRFILKKWARKECKLQDGAPYSQIFGLKIHKSNTDKVCCTASLPIQFDYCPFCGDKLTRLSQPNNNIAWLPPYGNNIGFKINSFDIDYNKILGEPGRQLNLPPVEGNYHFFSLKMGAESRVFFANHKSNGKWWILSDIDSGVWVELKGKTPISDLPVWSWSSATDKTESCLAIPSDQGPLCIEVDWLLGEVIIQKGEGVCIGGMIQIEGLIIAPTIIDKVFYFQIKKDNDKKWSRCKLDDRLTDFDKKFWQHQEVERYLGIPILDESKMAVYWLSRLGYVKVHIGENLEIDYSFRPWETDEYPAKAMIDLGPPYRKKGVRGGIWQLCSDVNTDKTVRMRDYYKIIKLDGEEGVDEEKVEDGEFVTTGRASFTWFTDYWDDLGSVRGRESISNTFRFPIFQNEKDGVVFLIKYDIASNSLSSTYSTVINFKKNREKAHVKFTFQSSGLPQKTVRVMDGNDIVETILIPVSAIGEVSVSIYNDYFILYIPETNQIYYWNI